MTERSCNRERKPDKRKQVSLKCWFFFKYLFLRRNKEKDSTVSEGQGEGGKQSEGQDV
jgi:hypothetical protein